MTGMKMFGVFAETVLGSSMTGIINDMLDVNNMSDDQILEALAITKALPEEERNQGRIMLLIREMMSRPEGTDKLMNHIVDLNQKLHGEDYAERDIEQLKEILNDSI